MLILACTVMIFFHQFLKFSCICEIFPASEIMSQNLLKAICDLSLSWKRNITPSVGYVTREFGTRRKLKRKRKGRFPPDLWNCHVMLIKSEFLLTAISLNISGNCIKSNVYWKAGVFSHICVSSCFLHNIFPFPLWVTHSHNELLTFYFLNLL